MKTKKVSVIIPVHNSEKHILECLNSVIHQTYSNLEIIIVDDASKDSSVSIIKSVNDKRIKLVSLKENVGVALARNKGVETATGDYICFLDSDDYWYLDKIQKQVQFISGKAFIYTSYEFLHDGRFHKIHVPLSLTYEEALKNTTIFTSTVMFSMEYLTKEDIMMPNIRLGQDTATWWKVLKKGVTAYGMDEVLSVYRVEGKSLSSNKIRALKRTWNIYKRENLSFFKRVYCFCWYIYHAIARRI